MKASRIGLTTILLVYSAIAHCGEDAFAKWAAAHALPITTVEPGEDFSDLLPLKPVVGAARVVALGEAMHNTHELLALRNRLFRFLVERMGFTAIALESGFTESLNARSLIESGEGDADTAARTALPSGLTRYLENRALIQWMRDYNATASSAGSRGIRLYGIDLTDGARPSGARLTIDSALTFLSRADPKAAQKIRESTESLPGPERRAFGPLSATAQAEFEASITAIANALQKSRKSLIARTSEDEYRWALHNLDVARQLAKCLFLTPESKDMNLWAITMTCRDYGMAENVQWALKNEGRQGRVLVFAHDGHVMSAKEDGRRWAKARERPSMMGLYLRQVYGKDLYIIATFAANTAGGLRPSLPLEVDSIDSHLVAVGLPLFFLDLRMARRDKDALAWFSTRRPTGAHLGSQGLITPSTALDAFLFVNTLTPAIQFPGKAP